MRLDQYVLEQFPAFASKKQAYKAVKKGLVTVNGEQVAPNYEVLADDEVHYAAPQAEHTIDYQLALVFEDDHLALIEKPAGLLSSGRQAVTVQKALAANLTPSAQPDVLPTPKLCHRLDQVTHGLLLAAKTAHAQVSLGRQFELRQVKKCYHALVSGELQGSGQVALPIEGRRADTRYEALRSFQYEGHKLTLVALYPETGRKHQLRLHMRELGHPIVGDRRYGRQDTMQLTDYLCLSACALEFRHPATDELLSFSVAVPQWPR